MFAICVESSHSKGMGHFFRVLNIIEFLESKREPYKLFINHNNQAEALLRENGVPFSIVDLNDVKSDWESKFISQYGITTWINDYLDTDIEHAVNVKKNGVKLVTFDDRGSGSELSDVNIAALVFEKGEILKGKKVLVGIEYLILNRKIDIYKRVRTKVDNIIVTMGGSDTHGVSLKIISILKQMNIRATVIIGPSFLHQEELKALVDDRFIIKHDVQSLVEEFSNYDLAITGGGITPFEANASGLPCIIVANEVHEIKNARLLENLGSSIFAGYHENIKVELFDTKLQLETMSRNGIKYIKTDAIEKIYGAIKHEKKDCSNSPA